MSRIGSEVARLRKEKGLTPKQLGKLVGVSDSFILDVESGKKVVNDELAARLYRVLGQQEDRVDIYGSDDPGNKTDSMPGTPSGTVPKTASKAGLKPVQTAQPVQQVWSDALASILKSVPIFGYKLDTAADTRQLPIVSNKVEGHPKDKVFYLRVEEEDMAGFRISKGDLALCFSMQEVDKDGIYFIEYHDKRAIRQVKRLDSSKLLLVSNKGTLATETVPVKEVKVLARLIRLEIVL